MENDDWTAHTLDLFDLESSAQGRDLKIRGKDGETRMSLRFEELGIDKFEALLARGGFSTDRVHEFVQWIGAPANVPMWSIQGRLIYGDTTLQINRFEVELSTGSLKNIHIGTGLLAGGTAALRIDSGGVASGVR
jgi:hypothetical protein